MGLMDRVMGALGGASGSGNRDASRGDNPMMDIMMQMLSINGPMGGLSGLAKVFQDKGMGDLMVSWIGTGQNAPISADQIKTILGRDRLGQIANQLGMDEHQAAGRVADFLPLMIDKRTPNGQIQQSDLMSQSLKFLNGRH